VKGPGLGPLKGPCGQPPSESLAVARYGVQFVNILRGEQHQAKYITFLVSACTVIALAIAAGALSSDPPDR